MSGRFQPEHGADSPEARQPYTVVMDERYEGDRITVRIAAAWGPRDAIKQAEVENPNYTAVFVERGS